MGDLGIEHTRTPNIFAMSHLLPETRDQYLSSSFCAPSTLSTTSSLPNVRSAPPQPMDTYVFASMRSIISDCSLTMVANCPKIDPSSLMVASMASMACPRCWMYVFCPSSII
jgi:hypothetical protein